MQRDQQYFPQNPGLAPADGGGYIANPPPVTSFFGQNVNFQPSKTCPRNFLIFDRTDNHSQIMFNPATAPTFGYPGLNASVPYFHDNMLAPNNLDDPREVSSFMKEDSADIDALLSYGEEEEEEEEELSTARTQGNDANDTADSCSSRPRKSRLALSSSSSSSHKSSGSERKRRKIKKMMKSLRGIVPGGHRMNSVAVLDEAVRYLKSLKVEVQKIGVGNLKN